MNIMAVSALGIILIVVAAIVVLSLVAVIVVYAIYMKKRKELIQSGVLPQEKKIL